MPGKNHKLGIGEPGFTSLRNSHLTASLQTPFDTVENAHDYVRLLGEAIAEAKRDVAADLALAAKARSDRRLQALQIVQFKLDKLEQHLKTSSRLLNDLRSLRRLLLEERYEPTAASLEKDSEDQIPSDVAAD